MSIEMAFNLDWIRQSAFPAKGTVQKTCFRYQELYSPIKSGRQHNIDLLFPGAMNKVAVHKVSQRLTWTIGECRKIDRIRAESNL